MDSNLALDVALAIGGIAVGAFFRGLAIARQQHEHYVPRTEWNIALEGLRAQLAALQALHTEDRESRQVLRESVGKMSAVLYRIQGSLGKMPFGKEEGD